jgi:hypothetical protein
MYFSAKTVVEFFCGFHVCHMEAVEFFGKHADKGVGAEEADRFFFYPIFICIGIAFFNGIQPVSFFCVVYSADSVEKKKEILYFLRFFPAAVVPAFPVEKRNFSAGAAQDIPRRRTAVDDIRIVECGKRRAYAVEKILFFFKGEIRIFHPIFYRGAAVTGDHVFGCENFDLRNEPGACLRGDGNPGDFEKKFRFRRLFYQPVSFIAVLSFDPENGIIDFKSYILLIRVAGDFFFRRLFYDFCIHDFLV